MIRLKTLRLILPLALGTLPCAHAYIFSTFTSGTPAHTIQLKRTDNAGIQYYLNSLVVSGAQSSLSGKTVISKSSDPAAAVRAAMANWNNIGANVNFKALLSTSALTDPNPNNADCKNEIQIAATAADLSVLGYVSPASPGIVAVTNNVFLSTAGSVCGGSTSVDAGIMFDSDIVLNPYITFSTDGATGTTDLQAVLTHELGHALGLNHSGLVGTTMYPYAAKTERHLGADETSFAISTYPLAPNTLGTIGGKITLAGSAVQFGLVTLIDQTAGNTLGALTAIDGTYSVQAPAGSYIVYAEPFNSFISPGNIYSLGATATGTIDPSQVTAGFLPTFLGTTNAPTAVALAAGQSATANINVTPGVNALTPPAYGLGAAGAVHDVLTAASITGGITVTSGQSVDLALVGGGVDSTISVLVFGRGISVKAGSTVVDASVNFGVPMVRTTLVIPAQTDVTLASLWIVKGTSILPISGGLVINPATPTLSSVQDAESGRKSFTSGQWVAIYGANLAGTTRTWNGATDFLGGVIPGSPLPTVLDGVSVTVNNVPAAVYFVCSVCSPTQINFLTPTGLPNGPVPVVVTNNGTVSAAFTGTVVTASPSLFSYPAGSSLYPAAVHLNGTLVGDPAALAGTVKAHPGETISFYANGLAASTGDVIVGASGFSGAVTISAGSTSLTVLGTALVAAGEYQINVTLPASLAPGNYTLTMTVPGGSTSDSAVSVTLPVGP